MPSSATTSLCTRSHVLPFLFTFMIYRPSSHLQSRERKTAIFRGHPGEGCHMSWTKIRPGTRGGEPVMKVDLWPVGGTPARGRHRGHCGDAGGGGWGPPPAPGVFLSSAGG